MSSLSTISTGVLASLGAYLGSSIGEVCGLHDWLVPGAVWRSREPHVVLSFDDGPHPEKTPRLLDVLGSSNVKAVFFVVGQQVERFPDLVRRISAEGHQIGNHSWSHPPMLVLTRSAIAHEIDRCQKIVADVVGKAPTIARPPYGLRDFRYNQVLLERGLTPVLWSKNSRDYWGSSPSSLLQRLERSRPGDIILMHDGDPKAIHTVSAVDLWLRTNPTVGGL